MTVDNSEEKAFLYELYNQTKGDIDTQVSMHDIGNALGLESNESGVIAENLFIQGLAELKTLSGGIGITKQGMLAIDIKPPSKPGDEFLDLGKSRILEDSGKIAVEKIIQDIKDNINLTKQSYDDIETLIMDIKTIEIQMLSPQPKTQIIREILRSIQTNLNKKGPEELSARLEILVAS